MSDYLYYRRETIAERVGAPPRAASSALDALAEEIAAREAEGGCEPLAEYEPPMEPEDARFATLAECMERLTAGAVLRDLHSFHAGRWIEGDGKEPVKVSSAVYRRLCDRCRLVKLREGPVRKNGRRVRWYRLALEPNASPPES